jgi:hypothetical protein
VDSFFNNNKNNDNDDDDDDDNRNKKEHEKALKTTGKTLCMVVEREYKSIRK